MNWSSTMDDAPDLADFAGLLLIVLIGYALIRGLELIFA